MATTMTPEDEKMIGEWDGGGKKGIAITCNVSKDPRTEMMEAFCEKLSQLSPNVRVSFKKADDDEAAPSIEIHRSISYHAIPQGPELKPFLDALAASKVGTTGFGLDEIGSPLESLKTPSFLRLFIASQCVHCPKMVRDLMPMAITSRLVTFTVIDGLLFPEMGEPYGIKSAPTLVLNDHMQWTGLTPVDEIVSVMLKQDPSQLSADSMESLLGDGRADLVAQMMMAEGKIFPAFIELLVHEKWPVRLGAMVVAEEMSQQDGELAAKIVEPLWERFQQLSEQVRGDAVHVLGMVGTRDTVSCLEDVLSGPYDHETLEASAEAIMAIRKREERKGK